MFRASFDYRRPFRFYRESEEDPGVYLCKLWKIESRHRESNLSSTRFAPHHPNFLGALSTHHGEPQARTTLSPLTIRGRSSTRCGGVLARVFGRLIAASFPLHPLGAWLDTRLRVKWGAERGVRKNIMHFVGKAGPSPL